MPLTRPLLLPHESSRLPSLPEDLERLRRATRLLRSRCLESESEGAEESESESDEEESELDDESELEEEPDDEDLDWLQDALIGWKIGVCWYPPFRSFPCRFFAFRLILLSLLLQVSFLLLGLQYTVCSTTPRKQVHQRDMATLRQGTQRTCS
jgi:hypothetical protein